MYILLDCDNFKGIINMLSDLLTIIRIIVPIGLIVMTGMDIFKKVINPEDKDGQKKILNRLLAAIIVFFVPMILRFILKLVTIGNGETIDIENSCWGALL